MNMKSKTESRKQAWEFVGTAFLAVVLTLAFVNDWSPIDSFSTVQRYIYAVGVFPTAWLLGPKYGRLCRWLWNRADRKPEHEK